MSEQPATIEDKGRRRRSVEALDTRIAFIPRGHVILVISTALVMAAAVFWGVTGIVPTKIIGKGIIIREGQQTFAIRTNAQGRVGRILVKEGDAVVAGQLLVEILRPELDEQIVSAQHQLANLKADLVDLELRLDSELKAQEKSTAGQVAAANAAIATAEGLKEKLKARVAALQDLVTRGTVRLADVLNLEFQAEDADNKVALLKVQLEQAKGNLVEFDIKAKNRLAEARLGVSKQERAVAQLEAERTDTRELRAPVAGFIFEVHVAPGQAVTFKDSLVTLARGGAGFEVLAFLGPEHGGRLAKGQHARVVPATVRLAEFGRMRGDVIQVSEAPVSLLEIDNLVANRQLAEAFVRHGEPYLTRIKLYPTADNPSGFQWWSGSGPPFPVTVGALASVEVVVREQRPIALVLPAIRALLYP
jgi:HlyD family secretion protein